MSGLVHWQYAWLLLPGLHHGDQLSRLRHIVDLHRTMGKANHAVRADDKDAAQLAHVLIATDRRAMGDRGLDRVLELGKARPALQVHVQQTVGGVGRAPRIGQHGKGQLELRAKLLGFGRRALPNRDDPEIRGLEVVPLVTQLHELLSAMRSPKVPHKH